VPDQTCRGGVHSRAIAAHAPGASARTFQSPEQSLEQGPNKSLEQSPNKGSNKGSNKASNKALEQRLEQSSNKALETEEYRRRRRTDQGYLRFPATPESIAARLTLVSTRLVALLLTF
jgi:hypothetical protein